MLSIDRNVKNKKIKLKIVNQTVKWFREGGRTVGSGAVKNSSEHQFTGVNVISI